MSTAHVQCNRRNVCVNDTKFASKHTFRRNVRPFFTLRKLNMIHAIYSLKTPLTPQSNQDFRSTCNWTSNIAWLLLELKWGECGAKYSCTPWRAKHFHKSFWLHVRPRSCPCTPKYVLCNSMPLTLSLRKLNIAVMPLRWWKLNKLAF